MFFASDNAGPVHPKVMERVIAANTDYAMPYGKDPIMDEVRDQIRQQFEAPEAEVYLVATGTAANALALACYTQPWQTIFCAKVAHIEEDECNAPEFYAGAAKLTLVETEDKMTPEALRRAIVARMAGDVHTPQRGPVSITQVTERGGVHSLEEMQALTAVAKEYDLPVHMDGARFANALVALGCTPAEMTWKAGVDVVSFGGTKNGCMGVEAVVFFDPKKAWEFELRRKRGAHLFSKHRYLSAQMAGYLADGTWLETAKAANANAAHLAQGHRKLHEAGARYYLWDGTLDGDDDEMVAARMVCDWSISREQIDQFLSQF